VETRKCILLVDDSATIRRSLRRLFEFSGWEVCGEAVDGIHALQQIGRLNPDLIVIDLSMPGMNGMHASRALKEVKPSTQIILFTMYGSLLSPQELKRAGISAVIPKGTSPGLLLKVAENLTERSAA
jgi:DNA-binding NarL/FixJ family response regulator